MDLFTQLEDPDPQEWTSDKIKRLMKLTAQKPCQLRSPALPVPVGKVGKREVHQQGWSDPLIGPIDTDSRPQHLVSIYHLLNSLTHGFEVELAC
jgi:hypothetical protein